MSMTFSGERQSTAGAQAEPAAGFRARRRERKRLRAQDRRGRALAELHVMTDVLADAAALIDRGWLQDAWFTYRDGASGERRVSMVPVRRGVTASTMESVCLVTAIATAADRHGDRQLKHRTLDLTWRALHGDDGGFSTAPGVRMANIRDLTRWNDEPGRTRGEVTGLLGTASELSRAELGRLQRTPVE